MWGPAGAVIVVLVAAAMAVGACAGTPPGIDGKLVNDWKPMADAAVPVPPAGACYNESTADPPSVIRWTPPVPCTAAHTVETVHVGTFAGDEAGRDVPPSPGSPGQRGAYQQCTVEARIYLDDDWRTGRLGLFLVLPNGLHWQAGARWYRCDVIEYTDLNAYGVVSRTASLKGGLGGERAVGLSCVAVTAKPDGRIDKIAPVACTVQHNGEFAGFFEMPDGAYPTDAPAAKARLDGCAAKVAEFAAVPHDADLQGRIGWVAVPFSKIEWDLGNRAVRCYAHSSEALTGSLKGAGPSRLPID